MFSLGITPNFLELNTRNTALEGNPANTSRELYVWLEESSKSDYQ